MKYLILALCLFLAPAAAAQDGVGGLEYDRAYLVIVVPLPTGESLVAGVDLMRDDGEPSLMVMPTAELGPLSPGDDHEAVLFLIFKTAAHGWVVVPIAPPKSLYDHSVVTVPMHAEEMK